MPSVAELGLLAVVLQSAAVFAVFAIGLQVHVGYGGLLNFGHVGYMAIGAYSFGIATVDHQQPIWIGVLLAIGCAIVAAVLIGIPTLRLRADFLAITAIAAGEIIRLIALNSDELTGGANGISGGQPLRAEVSRPLLRWARDQGHDVDRALPFIVVAWGVVLAVATCTWLLLHTPWGRLLRAVREDEDAARALGKNAFLVKLQALALGAGIAGLSGVLLAWNRVDFSPASFHPIQTFLCFVIVIVAGLGSIWGTVVGAVLLQALLVFSRKYDIEALSSPQDAALRYVIIGVVLMLFVALRPQGLFGNKREMYLEQ